MSEQSLKIEQQFGVASKLRAGVLLLRPLQWVKNSFLFAPLIFSKHLFEEGYFFTELLAVAAFCLLSSSVYALNDIADRQADRDHPIKKNRPVASGILSASQAALIASVVFALAVVVSANLSLKFQLAAGLYFVLNIGYSFWLKQVMLVDIFVIAAGFMLRVLAGAFAIDVKVSHWLVLCTLFVSLFLAASKRRGEILLIHNATGSSSRPVLKEYDIAFLDQILTVVASGMAISYALYTVADRTVRIFGSENLIFTTVFVLFGIFRYLYVMRRTKVEDNPTFLLLRDPIMLLNITAWFVACVVVIYFNELTMWMSMP